ncbi:oxidoreductase [Sphaerisporangium krabiense]|uniref:NADH dehydrogenase FAD-containing subunit n=1 Tax=Sphaerisporangium krabiense TaxID=763782 RepID=A0A7W9DUQ0_9ACTN|nr:FAD-dependent oxidoreductase [Sphaerisporangium krabiense]MBB5631269.1 NADH dehydrogenase FAD-containing subunit [Sphaerisporangium krabiense]GII61118.1 oxidoreductase [Sphaerisporangium krabiense]
MSPHIVVLGAGYSGLVAAKLLAAESGVRVTLVNAGDRFTERVRLHQLAAGETLRDLPLRDLLAGTGVELVLARVTAIDTGARAVRLAGDLPDLSYDTLVYALGSGADLDAVPGAAEHAHAVAAPDQAGRLRARMAEAATVAVVGGGLTGIESAAELAEAHPGVKVRLVTGGVLGEGLSRRGRGHVRRVFARLGVEVREHAEVAEVRADGLVLQDDEHLAADTVVWTTGFRVQDLAREAGIAVDERGRVRVDATLRSVSHPDVYGAGDAAAVRGPGGRELRMACATGIPTGQTAARAIAARLAGREARPLRFRFFNQCVSLGRHDALVQFVRADDTPREAVLTGRLAALYKEGIVRGTIIAMRHPAVPSSL